MRTKKSQPAQPRPWLQTRFNEGLGRFSPDGRFVAYQSDQSGQMEVYVTPFPGPGRRWQLTSGGANHPDWQPDGRRLIYRTSEGAVEAVSVTPRGGELQFGPPEPLFKPGLTDREPLVALAPDGKRILSVEPADVKSAETVNVVVNWPARRGR